MPLHRHLAEKVLLPTRFSSGKSLQEPILIEAQAIHSEASRVGVDAPFVERTWLPFRGPAAFFTCPAAALFPQGAKIIQHSRCKLRGAKPFIDSLCVKSPRMQV